MATRNTLAQFEGLSPLFVSIRVNGTGTAAITDTSNLAHAPDITLADNGTGNYTLTLNPFLAPRQIAHAFATSQTISTFASVTAVTYTGSSLAVTVAIEDDASAATDGVFYLQVWAF